MKSRRPPEYDREDYVELLSRYQEIGEVYNSLTSIIIMVDDRFNIVLANKSSEKYFLGEDQNLFQYIEREDQKKKMNELVFGISSEQNIGLEMKLRVIKTGEAIPFVVDFKELKGNKARRFLFVANEITQLKKEELKRSQLQNQLMQRSYKEGMAENAVSILHNVGNVLTGMIGSTVKTQRRQEARETLHQLELVVNKLVEMEKSGELTAFLNNKEQFDKFIEVLKMSLSDIDHYYQTVDDSFSRMKEKLDHIGSIISVQQQYARLKQGIKSKITFDQLIEDCLLINECRVTGPHIHLFREWDIGVELVVEKNGMIQTLSNLIINAVEAIEARMQEDSNYQSGEIEIHCSMTPYEVIIEVYDNGIGFEKETGEQLFKFGYSTKNRSSGFGLHNCVNFINSQGGSLEVIGKGKYQGACARIKIPKGS
jgi:nitrogen fixation/metabolism regulation signal transduction histidine kinase